MNMYMDVEASACLYIDIDWPLWKQWILLMDLLKLICLSVIAKLVGLKWGDGNMNHYA